MENMLKAKTHPLLLIASIAVILFCIAGVAAMMGWIPKSGADSATPTGDAKTMSSAAQPSQSRAPAQTRTQTAAAPSARAICKECGTVQAVREVEHQGEGSGVGAVAGGVLGGVVGHQIGAGRGNDVATVVGAVGGAVAGHQIEKRMKTTKAYSVSVQFEDGTSRHFSFQNAPSWRAGDRVRVVDGQLQAI
jgi:outer membrane lipoprotein SlyB